MDKIYYFVHQMPEGLILCSSDYNIGDTIYLRNSIADIEVFTGTPLTWGIWGKRIALVSSLVTWLKHGDFLQESEFRIRKICRDDSTPPYDSYCSHCGRSSGCDNNEGDEALVQCSNCKVFH